uniref:Uncharacterized protein n=1 Tax=Rhizophora mucronata TaxID=61149 RepID=A0A2P2MXN6_RHIMU
MVGFLVFKIQFHLLFSKFLSFVACILKLYCGTLRNRGTYFIVAERGIDIHFVFFLLLNFSWS